METRFRSFLAELAELLMINADYSLYFPLLIHI